MRGENHFGNFVAMTKELRADIAQTNAKEAAKEEREAEKNKKAKLKGARSQERTREGGR